MESFCQDVRTTLFLTNFEDEMLWLRRNSFKKYRSLTILTCDQSKASNILSFFVLIKSNFEEIANANLAFFIDKIFALKE